VAPVTPGSFRHLRFDPEDCARWLSKDADLWATVVTVIRDDAAVTILEVTFSAPPQMPDLPEERVRIVVRDSGDIYAVPVGPPGRSWEHRYERYTVGELLRTTQTINWHLLVGALCLWYPRDPAHLRWYWRQGLDGYLRLVQKHVWSEEYYRRAGSWPGEDVPHGRRPDGRPHPITTPALRRAA
jgi:hypothetical protein